MALIRDAIRIDGWARAQHATHTAEVRPEWCPLCHAPEPEPPSPAAPVSRPRYRLTPEGIRPCAVTSTPATPAPAASTVTISAPIPTMDCAPSVRRRSTSGASARAAAGRTNSFKRQSRGAGAYAGLLDRLEAMGATFCPDCYAYQWPDHTQHLTRGPVVAVAHCTLADPVMVDGLDGQAELVTIQEEREERAA